MSLKPAAGHSEVEIVLKELCTSLGKNNAANIVEYKTIIEPNLKISTFKVESLPMRWTISPFCEWTGVDSPSWWKAYNDVKHNRSEKFTEATLEKCLMALAALFVLNLYQEHVAVEDAKLAPPSCLFIPSSLHPHKQVMRGISAYKLPEAHKLKPI